MRGKGATWLQADDVLKRRMSHLSVLLCLGAALLPSVATLGWILGIPFLTQIVPGLPSMQPNTILGLTLSAVAVGVSNSRRKRIHIVATGIGVLISALGLLTLYEYAFGWNLKLDLILLMGAAQTHPTFPGRPSPQAAANFAFFGVALILWSFPGKLLRLGQLCAVIVCVNSVLALTGYVIGNNTPSGFPAYQSASGIALHTGIAFILLAIALFCTRPRDGMMGLLTSDTRSGGIARRILFSCVVAPPMIGAITQLGVLAGWYGPDAKVPLFVVSLIILVVWATWEVTGRAEREELVAKRILEERQIFSAFIENSSDFIGLADPSGKPTYLNPAGRRMVGLPLDFPIESTQIQDYYPPETREFATNVIVRSMIEQGHWSGEIQFRNWKTGERIPVSDEHFMIREPRTERVLGMGAIVRDISQIISAEEERERILHQLDRERRWLGAVFERAPIGIVMVRSEDPEHPMPNTHARAIFGPGKDWGADRAFFQGESYDSKGRALTIDQMISTRIRRGETIIGEELLLRFKDGRELPVVASGGAIRDESGKEIGSVAFFQDIMALKELDRLREEWAAVIAHDLRQPITAILLQAKLLERMPDITEGSRRILGFIESSAKHLSRMTLDLLDVSQLEAHQLKLERQRVDPVQLIHDIVEKLVHLYPRNRIRVLVKGEISPVKLDIGRFEQVIGNLISNASKYGYPEATIEIDMTQKGDGSLEVAVTNEGKGIQPEDFKGLFQRFHRTQLGKMEGIKGIGLGLYITRGLVEAHGGRITAESVPNQKTTFRIELPVGEADDSEKERSYAG